MFGNYAVNDDWIFARQIEAFDKGIFTLSAEIDPSFISQGVLGYLWSRIFGTSFTALQILTFLVTLVSVYGVYLIVRDFGLEKRRAAFFTAIFLVNPLVFVSAFTFMTDNYFLCFLIFSTLYYLRYLRHFDYRTLILGSFFAVMAILSRQIGIFLPVSVLVALIFESKKKHMVRDSTVLLCSIIIGLAVVYLWPKFGQNNTFILFENLRSRATLILISLPYLLAFLAPLSFSLKIKFKLKSAISLFIMSILFFLYFFVYDIFPVGNVFYIEGLYLKSDYRSNFSLFDNVFFKFILSTILSISAARLIYIVSERTKGLKLDSGPIYLFILFSLNIGVLFFASDFYERYLLPVFVCTLLLAAVKFETELNISRKSIAMLLLMFLVVFAIQWDFAQQTKLKWEVAKKLSDQTGYYSQIDVNDVYTNYIITQKTGDYTGLVERRAFEKKCFIQQYTIDGDSPVLASAQDAENYVSRWVGKPRPYMSKKKNESPRAKENLDKLMYSEEYSSVLFNFVGKISYVGAWCKD